MWLGHVSMVSTEASPKLNDLTSDGPTGIGKTEKLNSVGDLLALHISHAGAHGLDICSGSNGRWCERV